MSKLLRTVAVVQAGILLATLAATATQSDPARTVQDGVYTPPQADRGLAHYETHCQACHGANVSGATARALAGEDFLQFWVGLTLADLFERVQSMPPGGMLSLGTETYLELLAYLLSANGLPTGVEPLQSGTLADIMVEGEDGPQPAAEFALVQVVGCLTERPNEAWLVTEASEPVRTRVPDGSTGDARTVAEAITSGTGAFELVYVYPSPEPLEGHRVEVKGFLIRGTQDQLNVTALQTLAPTCEP